MLKYSPLCPEKLRLRQDLARYPPTTDKLRGTPPNAMREIAGSTSSDCGRAPPSLALDRPMWGGLGLGGSPSCEVWGGRLCTAAVDVRRARFGRRGLRVEVLSGCTRMHSALRQKTGLSTSSETARSACPVRGYSVAGDLVANFRTRLGGSSAPFSDIKDG